MTMSNHVNAAVSGQQNLETLAKKLLDSPEVKKTKADIMERCLELPIAATPDGHKTLANAIDELACAAALISANSDPYHPQLVWLIAPPHQWPGDNDKVPGSRVVFDNPDNYYRLVTVDGSSRYEIAVRGNLPAPKNFSFMLYEGALSHEKNSKYPMDVAIGGLHQGNIKTEADGSFTITIDSDSANGRINHIQSNEYAHILWVRNMFDDWSQQNPFDVVIKRIGGPAPTKRRSGEEMVARTLQLLRGGADTLLASRAGKGKFGIPSQPNTVAKPDSRGGGWGYYACGSFNLADDEALLLTVFAIEGDYLGMQLTDPWMVSCNSVSASGSLNNIQAKPNADGSYTYAISIKDPGIHNWLDTNGLHEGGIFIRWGSLPPEAADKAVQEVKLVKLDELADLLPGHTAKVTPAQRKELNMQRAAYHVRRYLT